MGQSSSVSLGTALSVIAAYGKNFQGEQLEHSRIYLFILHLDPFECCIVVLIWSFLM